MSLIGKRPVLIPEGVTVSINDDTVVVSGAKGELSRKINPEIKVVLENNELLVSEAKKTKNSKALWGLNRALIANMVAGVSVGYHKELELVGLGYGAEVRNNNLFLKVGYSHPVEFRTPDGIKIEVKGNNLVAVSGIDKGLVGQVAAKIRDIRKPEPYKGKGIKYVDEVIRRKAGKAAKVGAAGAAK